MDRLGIQSIVVEDGLQLKMMSQYRKYLYLKSVAVSAALGRPALGSMTAQLKQENLPSVSTLALSLSYQISPNL